VEETLNINGKMYRLIPEEELAYENKESTENIVDEEEEVDNLDLESIIKELESEIDEDQELDESDNPYDKNEQHNDYKTAPKGTTASVKKEKFSEGDEDLEEDKEKVDEIEDPTKLNHDPTGARKRSVDEESQGSLKENEDILEIDLEEEDDSELDEELKSSGIGKGENKESEYFSADTEDPEGKGFHKKPFKEEVESLKGQLSEYKEAVEFLRDKLHEVNILNAKLLFTNKLFKEFVLSNGQKMKIVETFDRAQTIREIKIVYTTLAESFNGNGNVDKKQIKESVGSASKPVNSTKPSGKIITEENRVADRFRKLAGLI